jgi:hypothetical protein
MLGLLLVAVAGTVLLRGWIAALDLPALRITGWAVLGLALLLMPLLASQFRPRLARDENELLVYLRPGGPIRVPLEIVECFLLGQAPTLLAGGRHEHTETASVVIRLSDAAPDWARRDVSPMLGKWCEGYITLRGTWCEPVDVAFVQKLNRLLDEARRQQRSLQAT